MNITARPSFDVQKVREDFPILRRMVNGRPLVYLDNAATTQKPQVVIDAIRHYYTELNSNVHRGVHSLSQEATTKFEQARETVAAYINAPYARQCIFTRGTTEGINLVAHAFGRNFISKGDEIIISAMEHHSNIVPWQMLCTEKEARLRVVPVNDNGELQMEKFHAMLNERTKLVAITHVSNALGTINPVQEITRAAHRLGARVLVDGAQATAHVPVDVQEIGCDFYAFSAHKLYGPTGIGVLYGREDILEAMQPWQGGGEMIRTVSFDKTTYNELPFKFEAGTPDIAGAIVMATAIEYINSIGRDIIFSHEEDVKNFAISLLSEIPGLRFIGTAASKIGVISFIPGENIHPYDAGVILDQMGIAIRTGHHCTQPLMECFGIPGTCRASFAMYNTREDASSLAEGIIRAKKMLE